MTPLLLTCTGLVQGVGFRPTVWRLAHDLSLDGWVRNTPSGAQIALDGPPDAIAAFQTALPTRLASPARLDSVTPSPLPATLPPPSSPFAILPSPDPSTAPLSATILPDLATCPDCLRELNDPRDRRYRYPFLNCTHCGPRASILLSLPYDRANTTMRAFPLCPNCAAEYRNPANRRFHAQPVACPRCGPRLEWRATPSAPSLLREDALQAAIAALREGKIVALKGIGGYHLLVDARDQAAVLRLRQRKHRDSKPFAVMFPSLSAVRDAFPALRPAEAAALSSPSAPIVLLPLSEGGSGGLPPGCCCPAVAPGLASLGVFLPYSPLHHLLLSALGFPLVATSANLSDEPLCYTDDDALARLAPIADGFLLHNRPIARPLDDSVLFVDELGAPVHIRRGRGLAPYTVPLPPGTPPRRFAAGAHLRAALAWSFSNRSLAVAAPSSTGGAGAEPPSSFALLAPHIGSLETPATLALYDRTARDLAALRGLDPATPSSVGADTHPDYPATRYATALAARANVPLHAFQHHHAHLLAAAADCGLPLDAPLLGFALDGTGLAPDGHSIWGGEALLFTRNKYTRVAHLREFPLPSPDLAARTPALSAYALCRAASIPPPAHLLPPLARHLPLLDQVLGVRGQSPRPFGPFCPLCSSCGRLFDAAAALLGLCLENTSDSLAPMLLQSEAERAGAPPASGGAGASGGAASSRAGGPATPPVVGRPGFAVAVPSAAGGAGATPPSLAPLPPPFPFALTPTGTLDWAPMFAALAATPPSSPGVTLAALRFHLTLAHMLLAVAQNHASPGSPIVLAGGCFQNPLLLRLTRALLSSHGFSVHLPPRLPPSDASLPLAHLL